MLLLVGGIIVIVLGLSQLARGLGMWSGGARSSSSSPASSTELSASYVVGTWTARDAVPCANWVRFNADHSLTDNVGVTGSWTLMTSGATTGILTMTVNNAAPTTLNVTRQSADLMAVGTQYWRRTAC